MDQIGLVPQNNRERDEQQDSKEYGKTLFSLKDCGEVGLDSLKSIE